MQRTKQIQLCRDLIDAILGAVEEGQYRAGPVSAMLSLGIRDGIQIGQLADSIGITAGGATPAVDLLERAGLAERRRGTVISEVTGKPDRRSAAVFLTDKGRALLGLENAKSCDPTQEGS